MVGTAGVNCKLNVRVCTNAAQPNRGCMGAMSQRVGHLLVAWGSLACPHCSAAWPIHPRGTVRGAGGRHSPGVIPTTLGIPDSKISGLRTSDMCWSSPGKHSRRLYAKAAGCGASPGRDAGFGTG